MSRHAILAACVAGLALPAAAQDAASFGVEAGVSTLGIYAGPNLRISDTLRLRVPLYFGTLSRDVDYEGNTVRGDVSVRSAAVMADYHFGGGGFRISAGLSAGGYDFGGSITNPTIDGRTYPGSYTATLEQDRAVAPVIAVGYSGAINRSFGAVAELGVRVSSLSLSTTGQEALPPADLAAFDADIAEINADLDDMRLIPFLTLGFVYRF